MDITDTTGFGGDITNLGDVTDRGSVTGGMPTLGNTTAADGGMMPVDNPGDRTIVSANNRRPVETVGSTMHTDFARRNNDDQDQDQSAYFVLKGKRYKMVRCLSDSSGEAQIFLVNYEGKEYVLKVYYPTFDIDKKLMQVVYNMQYEMIMKIYDYGKTYVEGKHRYYELMEYLRGGTMQDYDLRGDMNQFRRIALQAASALAYCHHYKILHKDIKPSNFFFRDEKHTEVVLGDFGISSMLEKDGASFRTTQARTPIYAAPEMYTDVIDGEVDITFSADYYSLGMTLFALWLGENPMSANERVMMRQKNEGKLPRLNELPERVKMIVQGLTAVNSTSRWGYPEVERWFLGEDVQVDLSSPFLRYKSFIVDPDKNLVAENVHELIPLLLDNERLALSYLYNGRITSWLEACGNVKLSSTVKDIITNRYPADQKAGLMASVYAMEPTYPYRDINGAACDDIHGIVMSILEAKERYAFMLRNPNDSLFLWLESHTKNDVKRLRSYFTGDFDARVAIMKLVYEIDADIPFLGGRPSANIHQIVRSFGNEKMSEDDWVSLVDGRLLSWMYSHEDLMACESLRIMTQDKPYSKSLAYKVLYNIDRTAAYDLKEANTPEKMGVLLKERLKELQQLPAAEFEQEMKDFTDPDDRFCYYAQLHDWKQLIAEANSCFDLKSDENTERMSAYDLRTASYRFCRILGVIPTYMLSNGVELDNGREIPAEYVSLVKGEMRSGSILQWMSVFYHEDPNRDFTETYSYEHELEEWVLALGSFDSQQQYYKRFIKAREETMDRIIQVRKQWKSAIIREKFWRYTFFGLAGVFVLLSLIVGVPDRTYLLGHPFLCIGLTLGSMTGIIIGFRSFFKGFGPLMAAIFGIVGAFSGFIPYIILKVVNGSMPSLFGVVMALLAVAYVLLGIFTDFSRDNKNNKSMINEVLFSDDVNSSLMEPLYYTFKLKSHRYKSSKFGLLDNIAEQVKSFSGESILHYILWAVLAFVMVAQFCMFSPKLLNMNNPDIGGVSPKQFIEQIEKDVE